MMETMRAPAEGETGTTENTIAPIPDEIGVDRKNEGDEMMTDTIHDIGISIGIGVGMKTDMTRVLHIEADIEIETTIGGMEIVDRSSTGSISQFTLFIKHSHMIEVSE